MKRASEIAGLLAWCVVGGLTTTVVAYGIQGGYTPACAATTLFGLIGMRSAAAGQRLAWL